MIGRIKGEAVNINDIEVRKFFSNRVKKNLPYRYNYTNYQDANPELALQRDKKEKEVIVPLLDIQDDWQVLDIGCGVGRWGDFFADIKDCSYTGADYCEEILDIAKKHFEGYDNIRFLRASFQEVRDLLTIVDAPKAFDLVLINGVMMYINDDDIHGCIETVKELVKPGGKVFVKESVGKESRLTLADIYSEELGCNYSAIYRSIAEYDELWSEHWSGLKIYKRGNLWDEKMQHRSETSTYYWLFQS